MTITHDLARAAAAEIAYPSHGGDIPEGFPTLRPCPPRPPERQLAFTVADAAAALEQYGAEPRTDAEYTWATLIDQADWKQHGRCRGTDVALFYPDHGENIGTQRAICQQCDVRAECLAYAINLCERFGVWAGLAVRERQAIARSVSVRVSRSGPREGPIRHDSEDGYRAHRRRGETPCDLCRKAHSRVTAAWQRARRAEQREAS